MMKYVMEIAVPVDFILTILAGGIHTVASDLWLMGPVVFIERSLRSPIGRAQRT